MCFLGYTRGKKLMKTLICFLAFFIAVNHLKAQSCDQITFSNTLPWRQSGELSGDHSNFYTFGDSINATITLKCVDYTRVITLSLLTANLSEPTGYSAVVLDTIMSIPSPASGTYTIRKKSPIDSTCILRIDGLHRPNSQGRQIPVFIHFYKKFITTNKNSISVGDSIVFNCGYVGPIYNDLDNGIFKDIDTFYRNGLFSGDKMWLETNNESAEFEPLFDNVQEKVNGWYFKPRKSGKYVIGHSEQAFYIVNGNGVKLRGLDYPLNKYDTITVSVQSGLEPIDRKKNHINIYPNPATDQVSFDRVITFEIYNSLGARVLSGIGSRADISMLSQGIYTLRCLESETSSLVKIIKQ